MLKDIVIVGGGPGGLYLSILLQRDWPSARVRIMERNRPDETYGFGVAFHDLTLKKLAEADGPSRSALNEILIPWDDVSFHVRGREYRVGGHGFSGCSRHSLLRLLQRRAVELGVRIAYERTASVEEFPDADLVIAADGSGSRTRGADPDHFGAQVSRRPNRFVWLGTARPLDAMHFFFAQSAHGLFVAHAYPHMPGQSTWIVETDADTFERHGLADADEAQTVALMEEVFREELQGHRVVTNNSFWRRFPLIDTARWVRGNVALLGDAKGTVHYSMGSGTKLAMEDAVELHDALRRSDSVTDALARYESVRKEALAELGRRGFGSMLWFERTGLHWSMDTAQLILAGVTRKTNETYDSVAKRTPELVRDATRALHSASGAPAAAVPFEQGGSWVRPVRIPVELGALTVPNRMVAASGTAGAGLVTVALPAQVDADAARSVAEEVRRSGSARTAGVLTPAGEDLAGPVGQAEQAGIDLLILDLTAAGSDEEALRTVGAARPSWPADRMLGVRLAAPADSTTTPPLVAELVAAGAQLVDTTGGSTPSHRQLLLADLVRHQLGVPTITGCDSPDEANTALATGRADLVLLPAAAVPSDEATG